MPPSTDKPVATSSLIAPSVIMAKEALACSLASMTIPPLVNWAEVIKSVQQTERSRKEFNTPLRTVTQIVNTGGVGRLLLTGLDSSMAREIFYNASRWVLYENITKGLLADVPLNNVEKFGVAFFCGCVGSISSNPFDLIRVRQQSTALSAMRTAPSVASEILKSAGAKQQYRSLPFLALYKGYEINCVRAGLFTAGSFVSYEMTKAYLLKARGGKEDAYSHTLAGFSMGIVGTLMYMPADAARTAIYNDNAATGWKHVRRVSQDIYRTGGVRGFWRGTTSAMARTVPACTIFPVMMEQTRCWLGLDYF
ncbi:hypothetical protein TrVE_jg1254 [Triparma verrucosa]|uniref:Uncharacterized protein n=1 Tax=Triparma verrucosa TaxID=1606542 RepID=A0A9W7BPM2_9STRA|nr:hypothetical protein TrVE_jg1254 [Triparma verrucosa]